MAISKKHVDDAMNGATTAPTLQEDSSFSFQSNEPTAPPEIKYVVFRLVKKNVRRMTLDGICHDVLNPNTNRYETIRLIRGASSIWTSELTELLKDKEYVNKNRIGLQFADGICRIGVHEANKLEYARRSKYNVGKNRNGAGKYDFYEYDAAEEQRMRYDKQIKRIELIQSITEMKDSQIEKLALFLGIRPYDDEVGLPKTAKGFKTELLLKADTQPEIVAKYLDNKEVEISYMVRKAIMDVKIDLGGQNGNVIWAGGGGFICKLPKNRKPLEYLTELAMTNSDEGRAFKQQLEQIVT